MTPGSAKLLLIVVVALSVRVLLALSPVLIDSSDAYDYRRLGIAIASTASYQQIVDDASSPMHGIVLRAYRPPGYPLLRAGLFLISGSDRLAALVNALLETIAVVLLGWTWFRALGERAAHAAAAGSAAYCLWVPSLTTESLTILLWSLAFFIAFYPGSSRRKGLLLGAVVGWAILTRPTSVVLLCLPLFMPPVERRIVIWWASACSCALVATWCARNWWTIGTPTLSTNAGMHMATSYRLASIRDWATLHASGLSESEVSASLGRRVTLLARTEPMLVLRKIGRRLLSFLSPNLEDCYELRMIERVGFAGRPGAFLPIAISRALAPLGYVGGWLRLLLGAYRREAISRSVLTVCLGFAVLHCVVSRVDIRLVAPVGPLLFGACGVLLSDAVHSLRSAVRRRGARPAAAPVVGHISTPLSTPTSGSDGA